VFLGILNSTLRYADLTGSTYLTRPDDAHFAIDFLSDHFHGIGLGSTTGSRQRDRNDNIRVLAYYGIDTDSYHGGGRSRRYRT
jgi:hypothetical protein